MCVWTAPEDFFLGPKRKWGQLGGGSIWRLAMAWVRGPPLGRGHPRKMTQAAARDLLNTYEAEQLAQAASSQASKIAEEGVKLAGVWSEKLGRERKRAMPEGSSSLDVGSGQWGVTRGKNKGLKAPHKTPYTDKLAAIFAKQAYPKDFDEVLKEAGMPPTRESREKAMQFFKNARHRKGTKRKQGA